MENLEGRGPCYLRTTVITKEQEVDLLKAYLNMAPGQTLHWLESGRTPGVQNVEIEGTEPYITGGHTASGYWVNTNRETTVRGLFAAGDAAGGCPQKYVTGALVEGEIAAGAAVKYMDGEASAPDARNAEAAEMVKRKLEGCFTQTGSLFTVDELEEAMQAAMDKYAGGIGVHYRYSEVTLAIADEKIRELERQAERLSAADMRELLYILEIRERLTLCRSVIAHLNARKETRWRSFAEHTDYPERSAEWDLYVNSRMENGKIRVIFRPLVLEGKVYEH
jgi:adenylylsulfate reductase subunit A